MKHDFYSEIDNHPEPEDVGTIRITARIFGENDNLTFTTMSLAEEFIEPDECRSKEDLNYFLLEAGIDHDYIVDLMIQLDLYVDELTSSASHDYYPGSCALEVWMDLLPDYLDDSQMEEAVQASFDDTNNIRCRPASKMVVKSLNRKIYNKTSFVTENCTICLEEFNNGSKVVVLPCGHEFDEYCIVQWFGSNHVCPLCRFELTCENQDRLD